MCWHERKNNWQATGRSHTDLKPSMDINLDNIKQVFTTMKQNTTKVYWKFKWTDLQSLREMLLR